MDSASAAAGSVECEVDSAMEKGRSHSSATGLDYSKRLWSVECEVVREGDVRAAVSRVQGRTT